MDSKRATIQGLLNKGRFVIFLDANYPKVEVPIRFCKDPKLQLVLKADFYPKLGDEEVEVDLAFGGIPHRCLIPYGAIWAAFDPELNVGQAWVESATGSARAIAEDFADTLKPLPVQLEAIEGSNSPTSTKKPKPKLRLV